MRNNLYYNAALRVFHGKHGCCGAISDEMGGTNNWGIITIDKEFCAMFEPTTLESSDYNADFRYWMESLGNTEEENTADRIIALLFMDQIANDPDQL